MSETLLEVKNLKQYFNVRTNMGKYVSLKAVDDVSFDIGRGETLGLVGESGCGKTTTLRMIAGFEEPTSGSITVEGESIEDKEPFERNVNTVFQSYALFPHMTIYNNIAYGLRMKKVPKAEIKERVTRMMELVQLEGFEKRYPSQLSGGQKQRVAIARALINRPKVLLLDEPLGALDLKLRKQMQLELKRLQRKLNITFIYVTHDQEEALTMSDRIAIMHDGILDQLGTPTEIYETPKTRFVATFIGETNTFDGIISSIENDVVTTFIENGYITGMGKGFTPGEYITVSVRPEKMKFSKTPIPEFGISATVKEIIYVGSVLKCIIELPNGNELKVERLSGEELPVIGEVIYPYWNIEDAVLIHSMNHTVFQSIDRIQFA